MRFMVSYVGGEPAALRTLERACAEAEKELEAARKEIAAALAEAGVADDASASIRATQQWLRSASVDLRRTAALLGEEETRAARATITMPPAGGFGRRLVNVPAARRDAPLVNVPAPVIGGPRINVPAPVRRESLVTRPAPALSSRLVTRPQLRPEELIVYSRRSHGKFFDSLPHAKPKAGRPRVHDPKTKNFYEWDPSHGGEVEGYTKRGKHIGVFDKDTGEKIKPKTKGRKSPP